MSYGTIVKELAGSLGRYIIAYDNLPDHGGCILYLDGSIKRIDISIEALDLGASDVAAFVRKTISAPPADTKMLRVGVVDGELAVL